MSVSMVRFETWDKEGRRLFGDDRKKWKFECPVCQGVQSAEDFAESTDLDEDKIRNVFFFSCIGRWAKDKRGCDYTSGGLLKLSPVRILQRGRWTSCFAFAGAPLLPSDGIIDYEELDKLIAATGDSKEVVWPDWVPEKVRTQIKEFYARHGDAKGYFESWKHNEAPDFGLEGDWEWRDKKEEKIGRFVFAWNNIGRCVYPDGSYGCPSF